MVFNATFNNISVISWRSVLLVEETGVPRENHRPVESHWRTLSHIAWAGFEFTTSVVIGTDCIGSYKSNYHMITATMAPYTIKSIGLWLHYFIPLSTIFQSYKCIVAVFYWWWKMECPEKTTDQPHVISFMYIMVNLIYICNFFFFFSNPFFYTQYFFFPFVN